MVMIDSQELANWLMKKICEPGHITAITARQGAGKTNALAFFCLYASKLGFEVITNIKFLKPQPNIKTITRYSEIFLHGAHALRDNRPTLLAADELTMFSNPRRAMSKEGKEFAEFITVIRHIKCGFAGTTLSIEMTDKVISFFSLYCHVEIMPPKNKKKVGRFAKFYLDEYTDAGYRRNYQWKIIPCPEPYQSEKFGTDIIPDISITELRRACTEHGDDIPTAIEENIREQLGRSTMKDNPMHRYDHEKLKVATWLKLNNEDEDTVLMARLCHCNPDSLRAHLHRQRLKLEGEAPTPVTDRVITNSKSEPEPTQAEPTPNHDHEHEPEGEDA